MGTGDHLLQAHLLGVVEVHVHDVSPLYVDPL